MKIIIQPSIKLIPKQTSASIALKDDASNAISKAIWQENALTRSDSPLKIKEAITIAKATTNSDPKPSKATSRTFRSLNAFSHANLMLEWHTSKRSTTPIRRMTLPVRIAMMMALTFPPLLHALRDSQKKREPHG